VAQLPLKFLDMLIKSKFTLLITTLMTAFGLNAAEFYAAPTGTSSGNGSINSPWDLQTALNHPSSVKPGDTIWLRGGTYRINNHITKFTSRLTGSSSAPITVRQYPGERATVDGNILQNTGGWVNYWGFEIYNSNTDRHTTESGPWPTDWTFTFDGKKSDYCVSGFDLQAPNVKLINLIIHDSIGGGIGANIPAQNSEIFGCLSYYNGWQGPDRGHGHGIYAQNASPYSKSIIDTMFFGNFACGFQVTGNGPDSVADNFTVQGSAMFMNGSLASDHQANFLLGPYQGTAQKANITGNFVYDTGAGGLSADANIGYAGGTANAVVKDNLFGTPTTFAPASGLTASGNTFASSVYGLNKSSYPNNTYAKPTSNIISVRPNKYEAGRANVIIYNYQMLNSVTVSPGNIGLNAGDTYELHNAQNFYGDIITGTYNGSSITIPMTGHTVAKPVGSGLPTPASTFPAFGAFVITKKSSGGGTQPPLTNSAPSITAIAAQTVSAGNAAGPLSFTVSDKETAAGSLTVTGSSANTTLVPNANIVFGGSGATRTVKVTPAANQTGSTTITIKVSDGTNTTSTSFGLTVTSIGGGGTSTNKVQVTAQAKSATVTAPMTVVSNSYVTTSTAEQGTVSFSVDVPQTDTYRIWARVLGDSYASDSFYVSVDGKEDVFDATEGKNSPDWQWSVVNGRNGGAPLTLNPRTFNLTQGKHTVVFRGREAQAGLEQIILSNDPNFVPSNVVQPPANTKPTISAIANQTLAAGATSSAIGFTVSDTETAAANLKLTAESSNPTLLPVANIALGGSGNNRTITLKPAANQAGFAAVNVTVNDGSLTASTSFSLTVTNSSGSNTNTNTNTNVVDKINLAFEAEAGTIAAPMTIVTNAAQRYVQSATAEQGTVSFSVDVPTAGTYYIWAKVLGASYASDSFYVSVDGQEDVFDAAEGKNSPDWQWSVVNGRNGGAPLALNPRTFNLSQGKHTIVIRGREAQTGLDRIVVTNDKDFAPNKVIAVADTVTAFPGQANQIPAVDLLRNDTALFPDELVIKSVTQATNGTVVLNTNAVTYTPKAGFSGTDSFSYTIGNSEGGSSTAVVTITVQAPEQVHLGLEAEAGVIAAPMTVVTDSKVPTRKYVQSATANVGTVTYTVDIPKTDTYTIWCKILGTSYASDSFFVSVDGKEDVYDAAEGKQSPDFQWSQVNGRNGGAPMSLDPRTFELTQGKHTIVIRGREVPAGLDRIIITSDADYVPADVTAVADNVTVAVGSTKQITSAELTKNDIALFDDTLTITAVSAAKNGTATLSNGSVSYTPKAGFVGTDTFIYTVADDEGGTATGTVTVTVQSTVQPTS
jgi:hypothetical protein